MIKTTGSMRMDKKDNMRGGNGTVLIQHVFEQSDLRGHARLVGKITIEPGNSIGLHEHIEEEEIYYIMSGKGKVVDGGKESIVGPGDAVLTGGGNSHSIENISDAPLEFFAIVLTY